MVCLTINLDIGESDYLAMDKTSIAVHGFIITLPTSKSHQHQPADVGPSAAVSEIG